MTPDPNQFYRTREDAIAALGMVPYLLNAYLVQLLRRLFSNPGSLELGNVMGSDLRSLAYSARAEDARIDIVPIHLWKPDTTGLRPALTVKRNAYTPALATLNAERIGGEVPPDGAESFEQIWAGSHTVFAIGGPDQAELLACEVLRYLAAFANLIRQELRILRFGCAQLGDGFEVKEFRQNYAVPVTVAVGCSHRWTQVMQAPLLKTVEADFDARALFEDL